MTKGRLHLQRMVIWCRISKPLQTQAASSSSIRSQLASHQFKHPPPAANHYLESPTRSSTTITLQNPRNPISSHLLHRSICSYPASIRSPKASGVRLITPRGCILLAASPASRKSWSCCWGAAVEEWKLGLGRRSCRRWRWQLGRRRRVGRVWEGWRRLAKVLLVWRSRSTRLLKVTSLSHLLILTLLVRFWNKTEFIVRAMKYHSTIWIKGIMTNFWEVPTILWSIYAWETTLATLNKFWTIFELISGHFRYDNVIQFQFTNPWDNNFILWLQLFLDILKQLNLNLILVFSY